MRTITISASILATIAIHLASCSSGSADHVATSAKGKGPCDMNLTATIRDGPDFNACGAYAYLSMGFTAIIGNDDKSWVTIGFLTKDRSTVVSGTYTVTNGAVVPEGQGFAVNFVYKEGSSALDHTYASQSGTLELSVADGEHYKGSFHGTTRCMQGEKDTREITGTFDVRFDAGRAVGMH